MFLSPEDIHRLTGRTTKRKQIAWLRKNGLPFWISDQGDPIVTRAALEKGHQDCAQPNVIQMFPTAPMPKGWRPKL